MGLYVLRYPFIPTNPLLAATRFFSFFFLFFFLNFVRSYSPKPQNMEFNFCVKLFELQTQFFLPKFFGKLFWKSPKMGPQKSIFLTAQARVLTFFDISIYLTEKYFDKVWGCHAPRVLPQMDPLKNQFFQRLNLECHCFMISVDN